jgi:hypothetical protein
VLDAVCRTGGPLSSNSGATHSSSSISAALDMAEATKLRGDNGHAVAVCGRGAMSAAAPVAARARRAGKRTVSLSGAVCAAASISAAAGGSGGRKPGSSCPMSNVSMLPSVGCLRPRGDDTLAGRIGGGC